MEANSKVMSAVGIALVIGGTAVPVVGTVSSAAAAQLSLDQPSAQAISAEGSSAIKTVSVSNIQGTFAFDQIETTPNNVIARSLYGVRDVLCGAGIDSTNVTAETAPDWCITVKGDVNSEFTATVGDLAEQGAAKTILGCTCAGNPAGGLASVNAKVTGVTLSSLLERAQLNEGVNVITFISDDGYRVSLPLAYVTQRYSILVYEINGEALCDVGGCANQIWLGSTAARYFAQNVTTIELSTVAEADLPPVPGTPEAGDVYANRPNVTILEG